MYFVSLDSVAVSGMQKYSPWGPGIGENFYYKLTIIKHTYTLAGKQTNIQNKTLRELFYVWENLWGAKATTSCCVSPFQFEPSLPNHWPHWLIRIIIIIMIVIIIIMIVYSTFLQLKTELQGEKSNWITVTFFAKY